jgi:hypothetical protein
MKAWKFIISVASALWLTNTILAPPVVEAAPARACVTASGTQMRSWPDLKSIAQLKRGECFPWTTISGDWVLVIGGSGKTRAISKQYIDFVCSQCKKPS